MQIGNEVMSGIVVSAGGSPNTFGLEPSSSGDRASAYSTLTFDAFSLVPVSYRRTIQLLLCLLGFMS